MASFYNNYYRYYGPYLPHRNKPTNEVPAKDVSKPEVPVSTPNVTSRRGSGLLCYQIPGIWEKGL